MDQGLRFSGLYVIAVTPFDQEGRVDEESLRAEVEFCIEAGVHGMPCRTANVGTWGRS